jgi:hypothetical protein
MKRTTAANNDPNANGTGLSGYQEGVPGVSASTTISAADLNLVQEELCAVVELGDARALDPTNAHQLADALIRMQCNTEIALVTNQCSEHTNPGFEIHDAGSGGTVTAPKHVLVGAGGKWTASYDGMQTWTAAASIDADNLDAVTWFGTVFVAVGENGSVWSSNGAVTSWVASTPATAGALHDVFVTAGGLLVVVGDNAGVGTIQTATSFMIFTARTCPAGVTSLQAVASNSAGVLAAVGAHGGSNGSVCTSTNGGTTWTETAQITGSGELMHVCWHAASGYWYASSFSQLYISLDLITWTVAGGLAALSGGPLYVGLLNLPHVVVAVKRIGSNTGARAVVTADGATYVHASTFMPAGAYSIACVVAPDSATPSGRAVLMAASTAPFRIGGWSTVLSALPG